ncbi:MAG TPA: BlaI/MecI/CopY family transcriptional regulator [Gemmatimonadaceae bacterium]|nr:BlaI/MecI/CopY family transcriptional regulator [Gemmatimonadaceae bacterium]
MDQTMDDMDDIDDIDDFVLGDRELDIMGVLWDLGSGTVAEVRDRLPADLAYTTVLTILRNLEAKSLVTHTAEGKAHRYHPKVARTTARRSALSRIVDKLFHGSPEQLIAQLVEDEQLSAADLRRLRALLSPSAKTTKKKGGGKP